MENQILLEKIGETKTDKLIREVENIYKEGFNKKYPEYFVNKNTLKAFSILTITENQEVKAIGMSCIDDLLVDIFGTWFGAFTFPTTPVTMKDNTGVDQVVNMWSGGSTWNTTPSVIGSAIDVGKGTTQATRQDFKIENFLQVLNSSDGGFNSGLGQVDIPATIPSTFNDSISESALYGVWLSVAGVKTFLLSHDNISPAVPVLIGQTINADYKLILS